MTHIGIDCRFAALPSGIGRYTREIVPQILTQAKDEKFTLLLAPQSDDWLNDVSSGNFVVKETNIRHYSIPEQLHLPNVLRKLKIDLLFSPHFNIPARCKIPFVTTIHDLILHKYPNKASIIQRWAYKSLMKRAVQRAKQIIAVSAFTAEELGNVYGDEASTKTNVIHEGISPSFSRRPMDEQQKVRDEFDLRKEFFLYVGNAKEHKNVQLLIDSFEKADLQDKELILVTQGKEVVRLTYPSNVRFLNTVTDEQLPALYSAAKVFVTASLYEGFCFPILEAAACGSPVIATNGSAIAEVAPQGTLLIEPTVDSFANAFRSPPEPITTPYLPTWKEAAQETLSILRKVNV